MKLRQVIATATGIALLTGAGIIAAPYAATAFWNWQSGQDASTDSWDGCVDPGTSVLVRAVAQDISVDCPTDLWLGWLEEDFGRMGVRAWADQALAEPSVSPLKRFRLNLALWRAAARSPEHLPALLESSDIPTAEREWLWAWLAQQDEPPAWVDVPLAQDLVGAAFVAEGDIGPEQWLAWLWRGTGAPTSIPDSLWSSAVLRASSELESAAPVSVMRPLCTDDTVDCARALVSVGEFSLQSDARSWDGGPMGMSGLADVPELTLPTALWRAKYAEDGSSHDAAAWWLHASTLWATTASAEDIAASLASPVASELGVPSTLGEWGDPAAVLGNRQGSPWATALAALALGQALDADVSIAVSASGVQVEFADVRSTIDHCGRVVSSADGGESMSDAHVLARAAVEAAGDARRRGDNAAQSRLLGLAERTDPDAFSGFSQLALRPGDDSVAARSLGARMGRTTAPDQRVLDWARAWDELADGECPPPVPMGAN